MRLKKMEKETVRKRKRNWESKKEKDKTSNEDELAMDGENGTEERKRVK